MVNAYIGNLLVGLVGGAVIGFSGWAKAKEKFDIAKFSWTVGIAALGGVVATAMGFDPWSLDSGTVSAVVGELGVTGSLAYIVQSLAKALTPAKK